MKVSEYIASFLQKKEIGVVFELSGGMISFITDAIDQAKYSKIVSMRHEQAAGFAAEGASRVLHKPMVAMATSGPGATNLISAIASAYFDSSPVIFITGQVNQKDFKLNLDQRQNGFQELQIVELVSSITKFAHQINDVDEVEEVFEKAWFLALQGRKGPVLIDVPINIQQMEFQSRETQISSSLQEDTESSIRMFISQLNKDLIESKRPLVLIGGGIQGSATQNAFLEFIARTNLLCVSSLMGIDVLDSTNQANVGFIGSYGNRWANKALANSDLLLALGTRLDGRQTSGNVEDFTNGKKIYRVDIDEFELIGRVEANFNLRVDLKKFFMFTNSVTRIDNSNARMEYKESKNQFPQHLEQEFDLRLNPSLVLERISEKLGSFSGYVVDVGQHQMWAAQSINLLPGQRFLTSGGLGAMGFALPAAIGVATVTSKPWVVVTGDGCLQLSLGELQTAVHLNSDLLILLFNNAQLGMVAQFQEGNLQGRYVSTRDGYSTPDFQRIVEAFGIYCTKISNWEDFDFKVDSAINRKGPRLIEFEIDQNAKALPKLDFKGSLRDL